jgi:hypothetical protein
MMNFNEYIFESYLTESILYFSPRLREQLKSISDNKIAKDLIDAQGSNLNNHITFIDINDYDNDYLSFMSINKAQKMIDDHRSQLLYGDMLNNYNSDVNDYLWRNRNYDQVVSPIYNNSSRNILKIGKLINKILPGKYNSKDIEEFVNLFKSFSTNTREILDFVDGKDIEHWYSQDNYLYPGGSLGSSCMSDKKGVFNIYKDNPETCKLVILKVGDKLVARALLWKINTISSKGEKIEGKIKAEWFLDRVYSIKDYQIDKIRKWAERENHAIRYYNSGWDVSRVLYNGIEYSDVKMSVKIKSKEYGKYPFLDTFMRCDVRRGILYNDDNRSLGGRILRSVTGGYTPELPRKKVIINKFRNFLGTLN